MIGPDDILRFWFDEVGPEGWYGGGEALDAECRLRFAEPWAAARQGAFDAWRTSARGTLALLVLIDQLPRNMFRGAAEAFATDARARAVAKDALFRGVDAGLDDDERQFFRLPLMHSEFLPDQEQCVRACVIAGASQDYLLHARAHRLVIRRFGRFPYRNAALGRRTTPAEQGFLDAGGYGAAVAAMRT